MDTKIERPWETTEGKKVAHMVTEYVRICGNDADSAAFEDLMHRITIRTGARFTHWQLEELVMELDLLERGRYDDVTLDYPTRSPEYSECKALWMDRQQQIVNEKIVHVLGSLS